jgi:hypothetical protein
MDCSAVRLRSRSGRLPSSSQLLHGSMASRLHVSGGPRRRRKNLRIASSYRSTCSRYSSDTCHQQYSLEENFWHGAKHICFRLVNIVLLRYLILGRLRNKFLQLNSDLVLFPVSDFCCEVDWRNLIDSVHFLGTII